MLVYIAGPMTGYPDHNRAAFEDAARSLRFAGHTVLVPCEENPASNIETLGWTWSDFLRADLALVVRADAVALLPGWEASRGALLEVHVAHALGMPTLPVPQALSLPR